MLIRYDPFEEADRLLDAVFASAAGPAPRRVPIDTVRRGDHVELWCELPGVDPDAIDVRVDGDVLAIRAARGFDSEAGDELLELERPQGVLGRDVELGDTLDGARAESQYERGVLRIRIPVVEPCAA